MLIFGCFKCSKSTLTWFPSGDLPGYFCYECFVAKYPDFKNNAKAAEIVEIEKSLSPGQASAV